MHALCLNARVSNPPPPFIVGTSRGVRVSSCCLFSPSKVLLGHLTLDPSPFGRKTNHTTHITSGGGVRGGSGCWVFVSSVNKEQPVKPKSTWKQLSRGNKQLNKIKRVENNIFVRIYVWSRTGCLKDFGRLQFKCGNEGDTQSNVPRQLSTCIARWSPNRGLFFLKFSGLGGWGWGRAKWVSRWRQGFPPFCRKKFGPQY